MEKWVRYYLKYYWRSLFIFIILWIIAIFDYWTILCLIVFVSYIILAELMDKYREISKEVFRVEEDEYISIYSVEEIERVLAKYEIKAERLNKQFILYVDKEKGKMLFGNYYVNNKENDDLLSYKTKLKLLTFMNYYILDLIISEVEKDDLKILEIIEKEVKYKKFNIKFEDEIDCMSIMINLLMDNIVYILNLNGCINAKYSFVKFDKNKGIIVVFFADERKIDTDWVDFGLSKLNKRLFYSPFKVINLNEYHYGDVQEIVLFFLFYSFKFYMNKNCSDFTKIQENMVEKIIGEKLEKDDKMLIELKQFLVKRIYSECLWMYTEKKIILNYLEKYGIKEERFCTLFISAFDSEFNMYLLGNVLMMGSQVNLLKIGNEIVVDLDPFILKKNESNLYLLNPILIDLSIFTKKEKSYFYDCIDILKCWNKKNLFVIGYERNETNFEEYNECLEILKSSNITEEMFNKDYCFNCYEQFDKLLFCVMKKDILLNEMEEVIVSFEFNKQKYYLMKITQFIFNNFSYTQRLMILSIIMEWIDKYAKNSIWLKYDSDFLNTIDSSFGSLNYKYFDCIQIRSVYIDCNNCQNLLFKYMNEAIISKVKMSIK